MPLFNGKSKKSFNKNVEAEMHSGKPQDQSLAIAYSIQRRAKKKMAYGGKAEEDMESAPPMAKSEHMHMEEDEPKSMAEAIMRKRKAKMMAEGGMVDIEENGEEESADHFDALNHEAAMKELYDDEQISHQPMDSNEHGDELSDEDAHDMVSMIRKKLRMKLDM